MSGTPVTLTLTYVTTVNVAWTPVAFTVIVMTAGKENTVTVL